MILQRIRIIVGDALFEPGTSPSEVWCATNELPHLNFRPLDTDPNGARCGTVSGSGITSLGSDNLQVVSGEVPNIRQEEILRLLLNTYLTHVC